MSNLWTQEKHSARIGGQVMNQGSIPVPLDSGQITGIQVPFICR